MNEQPTLADLIEGFRVLRNSSDASSDTRLKFWVDTIGAHPAVEISSDDVEEALGALARRGRMKTVAGKAIPTGRPLFER